MASNIIKEESKKIQDRFGKAGVQIDEKEIEGRMSTLIDQFKVPTAEAARTVISFFRKQHNISFDDMRGTQGDATETPIGDIEVADGHWVSLKAKVIQLWDSRSEAVSQTGLIGDETGTTKFTIFTKGSEAHPTLEEGKNYSFANVVTSVYQGQVSVKVNKNTKITELLTDIEVRQKTDTITGVITTLASGSGLIKRCPECHRALVKGACGEHGRVEGTYDLRIKAVFMPVSSPEAVDLLINAEVTGTLTGITLDQAKEMAMEALDQEVVADEIRRKITGRYFKASGSMLPSKTMLVESIETVNIATPENVATLIKSIEAAVAGGI